MKNAIFNKHIRQRTDIRAKVGVSDDGFYEISILRHTIAVNKFERFFRIVINDSNKMAASIT